MGWQEEHGAAISSFLTYLNEKSNDFILKGGTALLTCYSLDRFSEDIDLDGKGEGIGEIVGSFCESKGYTYRIAKDTDTVKRYMVNYGNAAKPLKIEISYRRKEIDATETSRINNISVYTIDALCIMKTNAYTSRDKIRDLYDLSFICNKYFEQLMPQTKALVRSALEHKGIEQFDYLMKEQHDELIDEGKLAGDFLSMYDKLELLYDEKERQIIGALENQQVNKTEPTRLRTQAAAASRFTTMVTKKPFKQQVAEIKQKRAAQGTLGDGIPSTKQVKGAQQVKALRSVKKGLGKGG